MIEFPTVSLNDKYNGLCSPQTAFLKYDRHHSGKTSSFNLRLILWDAGLSVSNKVLECLVLR